MADTKITDLATITGPNLAAADKFVVVDVSDTSMAASGTDKGILKSELDALWATRQAVAAGNSVNYWGLPGWGVMAPANASVDLAGLGNTAIYIPVIVTGTITVTDVQIWVTVGATAGATNRLSIYTADGSWQPTGTSGLVADWGTVAVDSTGNKTISSLTTVLTPGLYLARLHTDGAGTQPNLGIIYGCPMGGGMITPFATAATAMYWRKSLTYAAAEANPANWNAVSNVTGNGAMTTLFRTMIQMRWT